MTPRPEWGVAGRTVPWRWVYSACLETRLEEGEGRAPGGTCEEGAPLSPAVPSHAWPPRALTMGRRLGAGPRQPGLCRAASASRSSGRREVAAPREEHGQRHTEPGPGPRGPSSCCHRPLSALCARLRGVRPGSEGLLGLQWGRAGRGRAQGTAGPQAAGQEHAYRTRTQTRTSVTPRRAGRRPWRRAHCERARVYSHVCTRSTGTGVPKRQVGQRA